MTLGYYFSWTEGGPDSINIKSSKHGVCPKTKIGKMFDKGGFFLEKKIRFSNLPKILYQKTILRLKFEKLVYWYEREFQISSSG